MKSTIKEKDESNKSYLRTLIVFFISLILIVAVISLLYVTNLTSDEQAYDNKMLSLIIQCWSWSLLFGVVALIILLLSRVKENRIELFNSITRGLLWGQLLTYAVGAYFFTSCVINI